MNDSASPELKVFDYHTLRGMVGLIAFAIPIVVLIFSSESKNSISAYYYTESRDLFVGMLCIVGAFLFAYNGHDTIQMISSKVAAFAALGVALFPTTHAGAEPSFTSYVHIASAVTLFAILAYFCSVFYLRADKKGKQLRAILYAICGGTIVLSLVAAAYGEFVLGADDLKRSRVIFYAEWIALWAFGFAWFLAGAYQRWDKSADSAAPA